MIEVVFGPGLIPWFEDALHFRTKPDARAVGVMSGNHIRAVSVCENFTLDGCDIHIATDGSKQWATRHFLFESFRYPFESHGLRRVTGLVRGSNTDALRLNLRLGFVHEGFMRRPGAKEDTAIMRMYRDNCRWLHV